MADRMEITLLAPPPLMTSRVLQNFTSYSFSSDLYELADMAEVTVPVGELGNVQPGYQIVAQVVDDERSAISVAVFAGTVDAVVHEYNKTAHNVTLRCRDYSAFLVDEYCSKFTDYTVGTALRVYNDLVDNVSAVKYLDLSVQDLFKLYNSKDLLAHVFTSANPFKVSPGDTVAGKLQELAVRMGVDFYYLEDGKVLFGKLNVLRIKEQLSGVGVHALYNTWLKPNVNIKSCSFVNDLSGRYSKIRVFGQSQQGKTFYSTTYDNSLLWNKFMIVNFNDLEESLETRGIEIREEQREAGFELEYNVVGHTQMGQAWQVNREVDVADDTIGVRDRYLVNSRTMTYGPTSGTETYLRLGLVKDYTNDPPPPITGNSWKPLG